MARLVKQEGVSGEALLFELALREMASWQALTAAVDSNARHLH